MYKNIYEVKLASEKEHTDKYSSWTLYIVLFTTNTWIIIKKMYQDMTMSIKQQVININGKS